MEIVSFEDIGREAWDAFCLESPEAWFRHTSTFIDFALTLEKGSTNHSFAVREGGRTLAVVPLTMQTARDDKKREFGMGGTPIPFPALLSGCLERERAEILGRALRELDSRAHSLGVERARMFIDPLTGPVLSGALTENPLLAYGFADASMTTSMVALNRSEEEIRRSMRKGHHSDISHAENVKRYPVDIFDSATLSDEAFSTLEKMYHEVAGEKAGSGERWRATRGLIERGNAILVLARPAEGRPYCAGNMAILYKRRGYYLLSATLAEGKSARGIGQFIQWRTMQYLKSRAYTHYELGWVIPKHSNSTHSEKELAISSFKSHFSNEKLPLFWGEKMYA